jgi:hypothetical protein
LAKIEIREQLCDALAIHSVRHSNRDSFADQFVLALRSRHRPEGETEKAWVSQLSER